MQNGFVILDFGSQFTQIIARRLRELHCYSEIVKYDISAEELRAKKPAGIILSGGPRSVNESGAPRREVTSLMEIAPVLGICYGMQLLAIELGGIVESSDRREYGPNQIKWADPVVAGLVNQKVWMSHGDVVKVPPPGFSVIAESSSAHPAAMKGPRALALQFHPEVFHTERGLDLIKHFAFDMCKALPSWKPDSILNELTKKIHQQIPDGENVLCALSGGVDSTVVATLLTKALGAARVHCVFVDNGLLRKNEFENVLQTYKSLELNIKGVDASEFFLTALAGVSDPEQKRKIIGHSFIKVFKKAIGKIGKVEWLAQGTLYPDVIESVSPRGESVTIKSHHNVGGLPKDLDLKLIEPLRELFKDEVREIGAQLGISRELLWRHPFPGPGLAIRVVGEITPEALVTLKDCDAIFIEELKKHNIYDQVWQALCALLPVRTVGVQGDARTYERVLALRAVTSRDGMTADWFEFPTDFLRNLSNRLTNEVKGVNRVVYDITSKPPGTIEWE